MSKKYVAAVSGGPDSMALLYLYAKQIAVVCHVNYNKRNSANRDKDIVESFCKKHEIPLELLEVDQKIYDKYKTDTNNFQTIARMIRYDFFIKIAAKYKLSTILIAHNKDDFLETALMQKKRNSKTLFLGIQKKSKYKNIQIYRPLLQMWKAEIMEFCNNKQIPYGIDETNELDIYERNRIRKALSNLTISQKDDEYQRIIQFSKDHEPQLSQVNKKYILWELKNFNLDIYRKTDEWIKPHLIYEFLSHHNVRRISSNKIELLNQFIQSKKSKVVLRIGKNQKIKKIDNILLFVS